MRGDITRNEDLYYMHAAEIVEKRPTGRYPFSYRWSTETRFTVLQSRRALGFGQQSLGGGLLRRMVAGRLPRDDHTHKNI